MIGLLPNGELTCDQPTQEDDATLLMVAQLQDSPRDPRVMVALIERGLGSELNRLVHAAWRIADR